MPQPEALPAPDDESQALELETLPINVGPIAHEYLNNYLTEKGDRTFGIKYKNGVYYFRNTRVEFDGNNLIIGGKEYEGAPGLWDLLTSVEPSLNDKTDDDFQNYVELMIATNAISNSENINRPAAFKDHKWKKIISPIWDSDEVKQKRKPKKKGQGFLPSDPNALCERLELLMASKQAGKTGLRNEIVSVCDELLRQKFCLMMLIKT